MENTILTGTVEHRTHVLECVRPTRRMRLPTAWPLTAGPMRTLSTQSYTTLRITIILFGFA